MTAVAGGDARHAVVFGDREVGIVADGGRARCQCCSPGVLSLGEETVALLVIVPAVAGAVTTIVMGGAAPGRGCRRFGYK